MKHIKSYKIFEDFNTDYKKVVEDLEEDGMRLADNIFGKQEEELLSKLKLEYPDEKITIEDQDFTSEYY